MLEIQDFRRPDRGKGRELRRILRLTGLLIVCFAFLFAGICFPVLSLGNRGRLARMRARAAMAWGRLLCRILSVRVHVRGVRNRGAGSFIVSNHVSYVDIFVLAGIQPSVFISKHDVRSWPLLGWLAGFAGTIFIDRTSRQALVKALPEVEEALLHGANVILFPEGTTGDGSALLDFRSSFFQAPVKLGMPVHPVSISYGPFPRGGHALETGPGPVPWYGNMAFLPHFWKLIGVSAIDAVVRFNPVISREPGEHNGTAARKLLSALAYESIEKGLAKVRATPPARYHS